MKKKTDFSRTIFAFAVVLGLSGTFAGTAQADEWRHHENQARNWQAHEREARELHRYHHVHREPYVVEERDIVYVPYVIVEPLPMIAAPSSAFNIVIPLNIH